MNDVKAKKIINSGYLKLTQTSLIFDGSSGGSGVSIKPLNKEDLNIEYTPLNTTYLEFNSPDNVISAFCKFDVDFKLNDIYIKTSGENSITFSMWLKVNNNTDEITIFEFSNDRTTNLEIVSDRKLKLNSSGALSLLLTYSSLFERIGVPKIENSFANDVVSQLSSANSLYL